MQRLNHPWRPALRLTGCVVMALLATAVTRAAPPPPPPDSVVEAQCRQYFKHVVCSEALGRWLPHLPAGADASHKTPTAVFDGFRGAPGLTQRSFGASAPTATSFVHGNAGPPRGTVAYDRRHRIAFYGQGCCSYFETVLASDVEPPPLAVSNRTLAHVRTDSGIRLGDPPARVTGIYGSATPARVPSHPELRVLSYENPHPGKRGAWVQQQTFAFRAGRLVFINLYNGC